MRPVVDIFAENDFIYKYQSGFSTNHSTVTAQFEATDSWTNNIDWGKVDGVVFLDLKKAFDTVNHSLSFGVPQDTILGPLLFLLYINDLPNCLSKCQSRMYADDTPLTYAGFSTDSIQSCLNDDLVNVRNWLTANKLTLNMGKTEFMHIILGQGQTLSTVPPRPSISGSPIEHVTTAKSQGVHILGEAILISQARKLVLVLEP